MTTSWVGLVGWLLAALATGAVGALSTRHAREFYAGLVRPRWAPPGWLFGPVWTVLYLLMGVAAWLVWRAAGWSGATATLSLFLVQLVFNALWSWVFFSWRRGALAFANIVLLLALIAATILAFARVHPFAAALLLPYFTWVAFATALTYAIWRANVEQLSAR
ncbi:MAG TPA: TspO/MBR family protein [Gemmatimonadaceae bacterium]|nr:TspO/MBR family protein [Gemmatimonadaceae bacterium]